MKQKLISGELLYQTFLYVIYKQCATYICLLHAFKICIGHLYFRKLHVFLPPNYVVISLEQFISGVLSTIGAMGKT